MTERDREPTDGVREAMERPPETDERIAGEKHPVARMILIGVVASLIGIAISLQIDWFPQRADTAAGKIDTLYDVLLICSVPVFVLVMTIAIYSVVKFRARPGDMRDGPPIHGNTRLEIIWVTVPFIMVTALAVYGWIVLDDIEAREPNALVVDVTGQQFAWRFEYPAQGVRTTGLVLPKDRPVEFRIETDDVLHSFWVPAFRLKSDAVPGLTTRIRLTPNRVGRFDIVCAELCGIGHSTMRQDVRVVERSQFASWLERQRQAAGGGSGDGGGEAAGPEGRQVFSSAGCAGCHTLADAGATATVGPDLDEALRGADAAFVRESIVDPRAQVEEGFPGDVMPTTYEEDLSPAELDALVDYLVEASGGGTP